MQHELGRIGQGIRTGDGALGRHQQAFNLGLERHQLEQAGATETGGADPPGQIRAADFGRGGRLAAAGAPGAEAGRRKREGI